MTVLFYISEGELGGPTPKELVKLLDQCDISQSLNSTPCVSPSPSIIGGSYNHRGPHQGLLGMSGSVPNLELVEGAGQGGGAVGGQTSASQVGNNMSHDVRNQSFSFLTRYDTNQSVQSQKRAKSLKILI